MEGSKLTENRRGGVFFSEKIGLGLNRASKLGQKSTNRLGVFTGVLDPDEDADQDAQLSI